MIRAITFDLWDTIVIDDSDEAVRASRGLEPKPQARLRAFADEVLTHHPRLKRDAIDAAFASANRRFEHWWKVEHHTPPIIERLKIAFAELGIEPTPGTDHLVTTLGRMEVDIPPDLAPGIRDCLASLHGEYRLGIISDAIVTPGSGLKRILAHHGLDQFFEFFFFSDEVGAAKPSPLVFRRAIRDFGIHAHELVHIGDRESNDVLGPIEFGAHGILYTGVVDRRTQAESRADAICTHHANLPRSIRELRPRSPGARES